MNEKFEIIRDWLIESGVKTDIADGLKTLIVISTILLLAFIAKLIAKQIIVRVITRIVKHSENQWDDIILERKVFDRLAHFAPAIVILWGVHFAFSNSPFAIKAIQSSVYIYMTVVATLVLNSLLKALHEIYLQLEFSKSRPIKGFIQLINIFIIFISSILIISILTGSSPGKLFAGLGAMAAILLLIFKDTILGLVASIQLSANDMLKIGDWMEMPSRKTDGIVLEITLNTVKVQNGDKTISTIPTYALVTESFLNWRGMQESGGRRIKRFINIEMTSVKFCTPEMLEGFKKIDYLSDYFKNNQVELLENNENNKPSVNHNRLTNLGIFRIYIKEYLKNNPNINSDMTMIVRQLQPTENGIPLEIYAFSKEQALSDVRIT